MEENIIKCKTRVQKHGEVFTPRRIVEQMLDLPGIKEICENLTATFLEPAAGEGVFLVAILERKLNMISDKYNSDLRQYENYSLLALTTLYGIELLEDNTQICVMNMYQTYYDYYKEQVNYHDGAINQKVLDSAKKIISLNILNGDFLTRKSTDGKPLLFSEWQPVNLTGTNKNIKVQRIEHTLDEIYKLTKEENNRTKAIDQSTQLDLFDFLEEDLENTKVDVNNGQNLPVKIIDVYKEEMREID